MKTNWQQTALFLVGLMVGGGASGAIGHYQYQALAQETRSDRQRVQTELDSTKSDTRVIMEQIRSINEKLGDLKESIKELKRR